MDKKKMKETENTEENNEISAEYALADVLDNIFSYCKIRDLLRASLVCKSWYAATKREISRRAPERVLIPHIYTKEITDESMNFHISDVLNSKPFVALLFVGPSNRERDNKPLEAEILAKYKKHFPHNLVTVGVDYCMMDEQQITSCPGLLGPPNGILGLFLPLYRDLKIKIKSITSAYSYWNTEFVEGLVPEPNTQSKTAIILFSRPHHSKSDLLNLIKKKFKQKTYTLWGGCFDDDLLAIDCEFRKKVESIENMTFETEDESWKAATMFRSDFGLSITGRCHESWSTMINCLITKTEFDEKLICFRDKLQLKRHTVGLACGPRYVEDRRKSKNDYAKMYMNSGELMSGVKRILPSIPFIGVFNYGYHSHFGVDSSSEDSNQPLSQSMALSLMVLTFD